MYTSGNTHPHPTEVLPDRHSETYLETCEENKQTFDACYRVHIEDINNPQLTSYIAGSFEQTGDMQKACIYAANRIGAREDFANEIYAYIQTCIDTNVDTYPLLQEQSTIGSQHPYTSIIAYIVAQKNTYIDPETIDHVSQCMMRKEYTEISSILQKNPDIATSLLSIIQQSPEENARRFYEDFPQASSASDRITQYISEHYICIGNDKRENIYLTFQIVSEKLIYGKKNIDTTPNFWKAYTLLQNPFGHTLEDCWKALGRLDRIVNDAQGFRGKTTLLYHKKKEYIQEYLIALQQKHQQAQYDQKSYALQSAQEESQENIADATIASMFGGSSVLDMVSSTPSKKEDQG